MSRLDSPLWTINRMSWVTRTEWNLLSFALSSRWNLNPGLAGFICRSKAVVLTAFCSSPVRRTRLSRKVSAIRKSICSLLNSEDLHDLVAQVIDDLHCDATAPRLVEGA